MGLALLFTWISTCGASRSRYMRGATGTSSDRSLTNSFSIEKTGWVGCWLMILVLLVDGSAGVAACAGALSVEHRLELSGLVQCGQIVEAPDVEVVEVDLRYGAAPAPLHHFRTPRRLQVDADFFDFRHAFGGEQPFRGNAVGTPGRAVHADPRHLFLHRKIGLLPGSEAA